METITAADDWRGKYVLVRSSLNVPLEDGVVRNAFRLKRALPTLRYLHERGAKTIILSHIGRLPEETLKPVYEELSKYLPLHWGGKVASDDFMKRRELMSDGDILLAENLRQDVREEANDASFVAELAALGDLYVNDAFAEAHRNHASTFGLAEKLPAFAGLTLTQEVTELKKAMHPTSPSLFLLGGSKFETKLPLVEKYLELYDYVFIGGALTHDILKARGIEVGLSLVSEISLQGASFLHNKKLLLPIDVIVEGPDGRQTKPVDKVLPQEKIYDCGPMTIDMLTTYIEKSKTVLWNGPFGVYEKGYFQSTEVTAKHVAESEAFSVVGGGDTVAAIEKLGLNDKFSFVSIGGGAMLSFLETGSTPAIDLLA